MADRVSSNQSSQENMKFLVRRNSSRMQMYESNCELFRPEYEIKGKEQKNEKLWKLAQQYRPIDSNSIQTSIVNHVEYTLAKNRFSFTNKHCYQAVSHSIKDRLIESFNDTQSYMHHNDVKRVYYLSLEFLLGRHMQNALVNLQLENQYKEALMDLGYNLESLYEEECDPALGNGGLGRLAACFLDSLATLNYPAWGYGIRYNYGIFKQKIVDGYQVEQPDFWLQNGNPWEIERLDIQYPVRFYGHCSRYKDSKGVERCNWEGGEVILAQAYDNPLPGYDTFNSINLRLWKSIPCNEFDFGEFNKGDYFKAIEGRQRAEYISSVLYPNDSTSSGKELRLKQQYFFVCATLQDVLRRFKKKNRDWKELPSKTSMQLNDTHPALAILELLRILIDEEHLDREFAFDLCYQVFSYTNHTILPEALEKWSVELMGNLLPRHLEIAYLINHFWMEKVTKKFPNEPEKWEALSIVQETQPKFIRMANLCIIGSHTVNGVAALHSDLIQKVLFKDFHEIYPKKFQNKTNGVTPRRWIRCANPSLAALYDQELKSNSWTINLEQVSVLKSKAENPDFQRKWSHIKLQNKLRLKAWVKVNCNVEISENSLFDVQVKRIHEYKRQLMNALFMIHRYLQLKEAKPEDLQKFVPRTCFVGGKAAPAYFTAKKIIKLIGSIQETVNNDKSIQDKLKVVFLPNYNVSNAQVIIPASELSQHISTAGTEASGTSNMKFCMNGGLIIGTMDGANVEIAEEVGAENMFIFGAKVDDVNDLKHKMSNTEPDQYIGEPLLKVFKAVDEGMFGDNEDLRLLLDTLRYKNDWYLTCHDFYDYLRAQDEVDKTYQNQKQWQKMSILNAVLSSKFSSDRTITEYAEQIWKIEAIQVPEPSRSAKSRVKIPIESENQI